MYNIKDINKELDYLKMPKKFRNRIVNLEAFFTHDYTMQLSIRKDAGKTTQALILGLVLHKLYNVTTEYVRSDLSQTVKAAIESLYDVILDCKYVEKLFPGKYNTIIYKSQTKKFYLAYATKNESDEYVIETVSQNVLCHVSSLEQFKNLKSGYNGPYSDFYLYDEFLDTSRQTQTMMQELQNSISTLTRYRPTAHALLLGNNTDRYSFWWDEFTIAKDIPYLNFGGHFEKTTSLGTTLYCELLEVSEEQRENINKKKVRFSGFDTPKMAAFNGLRAWQGGIHPHIPDLNLLDKNNLIDNRIWIKHRNNFIRLNVYEDAKFGLYIFAHFSNEPKFEDGVILTTEPTHFNEVYGFGKYCMDPEIKQGLGKITNIINDRRLYFCSNLVGDLFTDYKKEVNN